MVRATVASTIHRNVFGILVIAAPKLALPIHRSGTIHICAVPMATIVRILPYQRNLPYQVTALSRTHHGWVMDGAVVVYTTLPNACGNLVIAAIAPAPKRIGTIPTNAAWQVISVRIRLSQSHPLCPATALFRTLHG
jgi:hypothetical protein